MGFDLWRFMASPNQAAGRDQPAGRSSGKSAKGHPNKKGKNRKTARAKNPDAKVPWSLSLAFFVGLLGALAGDGLLLAVAWGYGEPLPVWRNLLIVAHGLAMIVALVLVLNGFGWARLALALLAVAQLSFDATLLTRYFLLLNLVVCVVFFLKPANRYCAACATLRHAGQRAVHR